VGGENVELRVKNGGEKSIIIAIREKTIKELRSLRFSLRGGRKVGFRILEVGYFEPLRS
jgi:hypothetical protein